MDKQYTCDECLQAYYEVLEYKVKEQDAIIDWLANQLATNSVPIRLPEECFANPPVNIHKVNFWKNKAAQEAVKKND